MSSNSSKILVGIILGIIIGGVGSYLFYDPQFIKLSDEMSDKSDTLEDTVNDLEKTISNLSSLSTNYDQLTEDYDDLMDDYESVVSEKNSLEQDYLELESSYDELLDDYELLVASLPLSPQQLSGTTLEREYTWRFNGKLYELSLSIPEVQYEYYQGLERIQYSDYSAYVTHPYDDEFINTIIRKFNLIALDEHLTEEEKVNLVISFVQSLPYTIDSVTTSYDEYPRYPLETLVDNGGDCEDSSILTASLLKAMAYDIVLIAPPEHMAVGVNIDTSGTYWTLNGEHYFYLETTGEGWEIGEYPDDLGTSAYIYELNPIPMCVQDWTAQWNGRRKLDVTITVTNLGSLMADNYKVSASFDAGDGYIWNRKDSEIFDLGVGNSVTYTLTLDVPSNEYTRLIVHIIDSDGYAVDTSYSDWFDT